MPKIVTELDIELAKWNAKIQQIKLDQKQLVAEARKDNFGGAMGDKVRDLVAAVSLTAGFAKFREIAAHFDDISDAADKMGESTDVIQRVGFAAAQSGSSIEGIASSFVKLEKALGDIDNTGARAALANLGLDAQALVDMPLDQKIIALSAAFDEARQNGTGMNDLMTLLGKNAAELIPLLSQGKEGIEEMLGAAPVLAAEAVDALAELNDEMDALGSKAQTVFAQLAVRSSTTLEALWRTLTGPSGQTFDMVIDQMADEMNERRDTAAKRRKRPKNAINTQEEADALKKEKEESEAAKKAAKEDEDRAKRITDLQRDIENKRISLLPKDQQLVEFKDKLQKLLEDVNFADATMGGLDEAIRMAGDAAEEERLLGLKKQALEWQGQIDQLADAGKKQEQTVKSARTPGAVTAAINSIFGRSANELILDESKRQTQVLERIDKNIGKLAEGRDDPFGETFEFP